MQRSAMNKYNVHIDGYCLMYEGLPLLVEDDSIEGGLYPGNYVLNTCKGILYLVDLHTIRYYLATYNLESRRWGKQCEPQDSYSLVGKATPYHMTISMTIGSNVEPFSLQVVTKALSTPIVPYKVLPSDCLNDTVTGPSEGTIIKVLNYTPSNLDGEYVYDGGYHLDTYKGLASVEEVGHHHRGGNSVYHVFKRESRYLEFYSTLDLSPILSNTYSPD